MSIENMFLATVDYIPNRKYKVLGIVIGSNVNISEAINSLGIQAKLMEANGIIGFRMHKSDDGSLTIFGTAIKLLD